MANSPHFSWKWQAIVWTTPFVDLLSSAKIANVNSDNRRACGTRHARSADEHAQKNTAERRQTQRGRIMMTCASTAHTFHDAGKFGA